MTQSYVTATSYNSLQIHVHYSRTRKISWSRPLDSPFLSGTGINSGKARGQSSRLGPPALCQPLNGTHLRWLDTLAHEHTTEVETTFRCGYVTVDMHVFSLHNSPKGSSSDESTRHWKRPRDIPVHSWMYEQKRDASPLTPMRALSESASGTRLRTAEAGQTKSPE